MINLYNNYKLVETRMGMLVDFVVASPAEANRVGDSVNLLNDFAGVDAKGIDQVTMGTLYSILIGTSYSPEFMTDDESLLYTASPDGPWVQSVPQDMVDRLATLCDVDIPAIAEEWIKTEEFDPMYSNWTEKTIVWFLRALVVLARNASAERKALLMRTCLGTRISTPRD
jgi:hypothetical protein